MVINYIEGYFGIICGQRLTFTPKMNMIQLPNEGGKTTWSNFIRVMLYGLNTSKRDGKNYLSDKNKYQPIASSMQGKISLQYDGREVIIERKSSGNAVLNEFSAYYADTLEELLFLSPKDTAKQLFGISEESFVNSCFIDGTNLSMMPTSEFEEKIVALSSTGDVTQSYSKAKAKLEKQKRDIKLNSNKGLLPEAIANCEKLKEDMNSYGFLVDALDKLTKEQEEQEEKLAKLKEEYTHAMTEYTISANEGKLSIELKEEIAETTLNQLRENLPSETQVSLAEDALYNYEAAMKFQNEQSRDMPKATKAYELSLAVLREKEKSNVVAMSENSRANINIFAMMLAGIFTFFSIISFVYMDTEILGIHITYIFSILTVLSMILAFVAVEKKEKKPVFDIESEKLEIEKEYENASHMFKQAEIATKENSEELIKIAKSLSEEIETVEMAKKAIIKAKSHITDYKRQYTLYNQLSMEAEIARGKKPKKEDKFKNTTIANTKVNEENTILMNIVSQVSSTRTKLTAIGNEAEIKNKLMETEKSIKEYQFELKALDLALHHLELAHAKVSDKVSPLIAQLSREYFIKITGERHSKLRLSKDFSLQCDSKYSDELLDILKISSGTKDQLYLSLRLAIAKVLVGDAKVPIILDDPFITFDDERIKNTLELFSDMDDVQIIIFTGRKVARVRHG